MDKRKQAGDLWLTGSQMFKLMKNVTESLAGRVGIAYPIEIKKSANPNKPTKNFNALDSIQADNKKVGTGAVICIASDVFPIDRNNWYVPAWVI